jgi:hypothetical protein
VGRVAGCYALIIEYMFCIARGKWGRGGFFKVGGRTGDGGRGRAGVLGAWRARADCHDAGDQGRRLAMTTGGRGTGAWRARADCHVRWGSRAASRNDNRADGGRGLGEQEQIATFAGERSLAMTTGGDWRARADCHNAESTRFAMTGVSHIVPESLGMTTGGGEQGRGTGDGEGRECWGRCFGWRRRADCHDAGDQGRRLAHRPRIIGNDNRGEGRARADCHNAESTRFAMTGVSHIVPESSGMTVVGGVIQFEEQIATFAGERSLAMTTGERGEQGGDCHSAGRARAAQ